MIKKEEIKKKKKYLLKRLQEPISKVERNNLTASLASLIILENENEKLYNVKLVGILDSLTKNKYTLNKEKRFEARFEGLLEETAPFVNDEYLSFLLQLTLNINTMNIEYEDDASELALVNISDHDKVELSRKFYRSLGNRDIQSQAERILDDPSHYDFIDTNIRHNDLLYGVTIFDWYFKKPYIYARRLGNLFGCQVFNHEIMHGVDFYSRPRNFGAEYYGFEEIPTYTIDYLFLDFLEMMGYDPAQVDALRRKKHQFTWIIARYKIIDEINHRLIRMCRKNIKNATFADIKKVMNDNILVSMIELESCVIAHHLYGRMHYNLQQGLNDLITIMQTKLPKNKIPDFSFIGLDQKRLLETSRELGMLGHHIEDIEQSK